MSFLAFLAEMARALWIAATDTTRDPICPDCKCAHKATPTLKEN